MTPSSPAPLDPEQRRWLHETLQQRRLELQHAQQAHLGGGSRAEHAREVLLQDGDDATQRDAERELDLALTDREVVALADVDAALRRLETGRAGQCEACGEPIAWPRLRLQPTATHCIDCASGLERGRPRPATL
ncbi:MAG: hypothetical protein RLY78_1773 [Pseudomonadota bacterium]|jgi:DnaK suppressor protein|uniref:TraR/DksA family transcriptional regulator n=1 Tax=Pseudaquabacterium rugosum TaxID=2984194 RepID=A0ABU9B905_9BURK